LSSNKIMVKRKILRLSLNNIASLSSADPPILFFSISDENLEVFSLTSTQSLMELLN